MRLPLAPAPHAIAIIGMAALFPQARSLQEYWRNIVEKRDCIADIPSSHWNVDDYYDPDPAAPDKTYCKRGGFLPAVDFDPVEFGLPPNILEVTDNSQLLGLLVARQLLDEAGYGEGRDFDRERTAVVLGVTGPQKLSIPLNNRLQYPIWQRVLRGSGLPEPAIDQIVERMKQAYIQWEENAMPGFLGNVIAGRIANRLNLGGMNCVVDAACASSLGALRVATSELLEGRCDLAITGGVDTDTSIFQYVSFSKTPAFSQQAHPKPFDRAADGMVPGEGIGMLLLKRLADAERDGDRIYAVIRGIGASSDGKHTSIYAPLPEGQARSLQRAYADADVPTATVGLIEAHGTGTPAGDLAEFTALRHVFGQSQICPQQIALGSVKSQIGHTKAAAGVAGLIKATLALHQKVLPPTQNVTDPNPKLAIEESPFYLNTEARPWIQAETAPPRRAGVSSFGFGGTNFHVVLEEYQQEHAGHYRLHGRNQIIVLHAPTPQLLRERCHSVAAALAADDAPQHYRQLIEASLATGIPREHARLGFVAASIEEATELLQSAAMLLEQPERAAWQHPKGISYRAAGIDPAAKVVALFPGQGSQYLNMGKDLALNFPEIRCAYSRLDQLFLADAQPTLSTTVFPIPAFGQAQQAAQAQALQQTSYAQPAIGALSAGMYMLLRQFGFVPDLVAGHSFGELTALWAAQVLNDDDFFTLIKARGQAMAPPQDASVDIGAMLAVVGDLAQIEQHPLLCAEQVAIVNWNAPNQVVLAGPTAAIQSAQQTLRAQGYSTTVLPVAAAYHTSMIDYAHAPFVRALDQAAFNSPAIPLYANSTGERYPDDSRAARELFTQHMLQPVRFSDEIEQIYQAGGRVFVECGPRDILTRLVDTILGDRFHITVALNPQREGDSDRQLRQALAQLMVAGLPIRPSDAYALPEKPAKSATAGRARVRLSGTNYVTEKTKATIEQALYRQDPLALFATASPGDTDREPGANESSAPLVAAAQPAEIDDQPIASDRRSDGLEQLERHQRETLQIHEQHIAQQAEITKMVAQVIQQLQTVLSSQHATNPDLISALTSTLGVLRDQQAALQQGYDRYIESRAEYTRLFFQELRQEAPGAERPRARATPPRSAPPPGLPGPAPARPEPAPPQPVAAPLARASVAPLAAPPAIQPAISPPHEAKDVQETLIQIVSNKTGYPVEILEPGMDLEADLGIDSIKRVQILSALLDHYPGSAQPAQEDVAQLRTIGSIAQYIDAFVRGVHTDTLLLRPGNGVDTHVEPAVAAAELADTKLLRSVVRARHLPPPDYLECGLAEGHSCLITDDGTTLTSALAGTLAARGWNVVVLDLPHTSIATKLDTPDDIPHYVLYDQDEASLQQMLTMIQTRHGPCGAFIHLHPPTADVQSHSDLFTVQEQEIVKLVFLIAKYLTSPLTEAARDGRSWFCTITQTDGRCGLAGERGFPVISGGLVGLTKALNLEWERVFCRSVDLDGALPTEQRVGNIIAELHDTNRLISEIGYHSDRRLTLVSE